MNVRRALTAPGRGVKALARMVFPRSLWRLWRLPGTPDLRKVGDGTQSSTVMAPLLWIARTFPEAPPAVWRLMPDGQEQQDITHPMLGLLARPNPYYSGATLWMATLVDWCANGNAYWLKIRDRGGRPVQLWWVPSFLMTPKGDEREFLTHYEYQIDGQTVEIEPSEVVHFRYGLDPDNMRLGRSPLQSVLREVYTDDEAAAFTAALLRNMGVPGLLISPEKGGPSPGPADVAETKAYMREAFGGDKRGEPLVMSGPTKVQQFGFTPEQMDLKSLRRVPEERVTAVLGLPAIVAGLGAGLDRSTFANFAEAREAAYESNMIPAQRVLGEDLRFKLLPDFHDDPLVFRVGFDLRNVRVLQEDRDKLAHRLNVGVLGGWVKVSEARRAMDLDVRSEDEIYLRPVNMQATEVQHAPEPAVRADLEHTTKTPAHLNGHGTPVLPAQP